jgi:predicted RND superfamily exporter protein
MSAAMFGLGAIEGVAWAAAVVTVTVAVIYLYRSWKRGIVAEEENENLKEIADRVNRAEDAVRRAHSDVNELERLRTKARTHR